ncbi:transcriptional regulator GcvA [Onishia niordana]|uniref:transcriptional regulator GcvA n=1 Tax=Onishia niordana TaxID=2508711 RepID=UPI0010A09616|nr:transcriptional regulator GcvA [Halomonas niordiana]
MRRLPPLNGLRAFEAAARHESFAAAGSELHVTASAVSQQVRALEAWLEVTLFARHARGLELTEAGLRYLPELSETFDRVEQATRALQSRDAGQVLTLNVTPSLGTQWLVPRLWEFNARHPDIDVRIGATERQVDLRREDVDLAVRLGPARETGVVSELLLRETLAPVCAPALLEGEAPLETPSDLARQRLLHIFDPHPGPRVTGWRDWLAVAGAPQVDARQGPRFSVWYLAIMEAVAGRGVALGPFSLVREELKAGRLVAPFDPWLPAGVDYYLAYRADALGNPALVACRDWLHELCVRE